MSEDYLIPSYTNRDLTAKRPAEQSGCYINPRHPVFQNPYCSVHLSRDGVWTLQSAERGSSNELTCPRPSLQRPQEGHAGIVALD